MILHFYKVLLDNIQPRQRRRDYLLSKSPCAQRNTQPSFGGGQFGMAKVANSAMQFDDQCAIEV